MFRIFLDPKGDSWGRVVRHALQIAVSAAFIGYANHAPADLVSTFAAGNSGWHLGGIAVGRIAPGDPAIIIAHRDLTGTWYLDAFRYSGQRLSGFPHSAGGEEINVTPALCDINGDGWEDIIFTQAAKVVAMSGNGTILWSHPVTPDNYVPTGGYQVATNGFYWTADGAFRSRLPDTAQFSGQVSPPVVVDLGGNAGLEILTAWKIDPDSTSNEQDYFPFINDIYGFGEWGTIGETWSGGVIGINARTGARTFVYHLPHLVEAGLGVGTPELGGRRHIYALNDSDSVVAFDKSKPYGFWGKGMLHRQFGKSQKLMSGSYQFPVDVHLADIDGDGRDECLVAGTQLGSLWQPNETILDDDGAVLWRRWLPHLDFLNVQGWLNSASLIPVNPDHDNHADVLGFNHSHELTFRYWNGAELVNRPGWPKNFFPLLPSPPVVGDVDGDGGEEIVIGTYNPGLAVSTGSLLVFALDGTLEQSIPVVGGLKHSPVLADANGDGRTDVIIRSQLGQVSIYNFGATSTNGISWAGHYAGSRRDGQGTAPFYPAGTPKIVSRTAGHKQASFTWQPEGAPSAYRIYRAEKPEGPFLHLATLTANQRTFTDDGLRTGWPFYYEVAAVVGNQSIRSAPFQIVPLLNSNLVANPGFEENDNSHWDKWFSGEIPMTNMAAISSHPQGGRQSMMIRFDNQTTSGSIGQYNQYGIPDGAIDVNPGTYYSFGCWFRSAGISQPSEQWLTWSSTKTGHDTNNRPSLPWPSYFTPHLSLGTAPAEWTYVNRVFRMPAGIPNIELGHRFALTAPGSGSVCLDNVFFRSLPPLDSKEWIDLIPMGSQWRYQLDAVGANWFSTGLNDSSWALAKAKFGAGSGPTNVSTRLPQLKTEYHFRKQFIASGALIDDLLLSVACTDVSSTAYYPISVYLNGMEIPSTAELTSAQGNEIQHFDLTPFAHLIVPGNNLIAVKLRNYWADWDDVAFDLGLKARVRTSRATRLELTSAVPCRLRASGSPGTIWNLQTRSGEQEPWRTVKPFTNLTGWVELDDTATVRENECRLYRLAPF